MPQLQEADLVVTELANQDPNNRFHSDAHLLVQFYEGSRHNRIASAEAGRPMYDDHPYIRIMVPGNRSNVVDRPVREADKRRFKQYWDAWTAGRQNEESGTPLSAWPAMSKAQIEELGFFNIRTVEQLANINDAELQKFSGLLVLKQKAKAFMDLAEGTGSIDRLVDEMSVKDNQIAGLEDALAEMAEKIKALEGKPKGKK